MKVIYYEVAKTPSTNTEAKRLMHLWDPYALTVVTTKHQTAGKGKFGKSWKSSPKDLLATFCFFLKVQDLDLSQLFRLGTEAVLMLTQELHIKASIKWPNDVLIHNKKLCGVLCETLPSQRHLGVALGIGINVNTPKEILDAIDQPAISLQAILGEEVDVGGLLEKLTTQIIQILRVHIADMLATQTDFRKI